jgi:dynein heavy chain
LASIFNPEYFLSEIQKHFENHDKPQAFGQHTNAEINSQKLDANELLLSILSLMPQQATSGEGGGNNRILEIIRSVHDGLPNNIDLQALKVKHMKDDSPLTTVLF